MAINLSAFAGAGAQFFDDNGDPLAGGFLYVYEAGTTTPVVTYTTQLGTTNNTNPIVLDAGGRTPFEIWVNGGVLYKFAVYDSNNALIGGPYDNIPAIDDPTVFNNLITVTGTNTLLGTSVPPITGYTTGATYSFFPPNSNTGAVTIDIDGLGAKEILYDSATSLSAGAIQAGKVVLIEYDGTRFQLVNSFTVGQIPNGSITPQKMAADTRSDIASAATVDLTALAPNTRNINITGTTTITAFTVASGLNYFVRFNAALVLTNNAAIVTQTGANITTAAGDTCIIRSAAADTVEILDYVPANWNQAASTTAIGRVRFATNTEAFTGTDATIAVTPANLGSTFGLVKLNSGTVSAAATLDILLTSYVSRFNNFKVVVTDVAPVTDVVAWYGRVSTNGGSSYDSGASNYGYIIIGTSTAGTAYSSQGADTQMRFSPAAIGNLSTEGIRRFEADISNVNDAAGYCDFSYKTSFVDNTGAISVVSGTCMRAAAQDTDAFQFFFSSGNITTANWALYGWN